MLLKIAQIEQNSLNYVFRRVKLKKQGKRGVKWVSSVLCLVDPVNRQRTKSGSKAVKAVITPTVTERVAMMYTPQKFLAVAMSAPKKMRAGDTSLLATTGPKKDMLNKERRSNTTQNGRPGASKPLVDPR